MTAYSRLFEPLPLGSARLANRLVVLAHRARGIDAYSAGDCVEPRRISHAVLEGHRAAYSIRTKSLTRQNDFASFTTDRSVWLFR
jgi:hypothetical protein